MFSSLRRRLWIVQAAGVLLPIMMLAGVEIRAFQESARSAGASQVEGTILPIPSFDIPREAALLAGRAQQVSNRIKADSRLSEIESKIPDLTERVKTFSSETQKVLRKPVPLSWVEELRQQWSLAQSEVRKLLDPVQTRLHSTIEDEGFFERERKRWELTRGEAIQEQLPRSMEDLIRATLKTVSDTQSHLASNRNRLLEATASLQILQSECSVNLDVITEQSERAVLAFDSPPLWVALTRREARVEGLAQQWNAMLAQESSALLFYARRSGMRFVVQGLFFLATMLVFVLFSRRARSWREAEAGSEAMLRVPTRPYSEALLVTLLGTGFFHPEAPRVLRSVSGFLLLFPLLRLLPIFALSKLRVGIFALMGLYLVGLAIVLLSYHTLTGRLLLLFFTIAALVVVSLLRRRVIESLPLETRWKAVSAVALRVLTSFLAISLLANILGAVGLASLLTRGALTSIYAVVILRAGLLVLRGAIQIALRTESVRSFRMIQMSSSVVAEKLDRGLVFLALIAWLGFTLVGFGILKPAYELIESGLTTPFGFGDFKISAGDVLSFVLVIWISVLISRLVRFILEEEALPRVSLPRGIPATVSRLTHYSIVTVGFLIAVTAAGLGLDRITILASAFGVGIGFGLQNVVGNFVSGLVLLFERPVKLGDQVQIGELLGTVTNIGIRASTIRTFDGADVIVPNGSLISESVINWTLADPLRRIEVPVGVAYGTDPETVLKLLTGCAEQHPDILGDPAPAALFVAFGESSLDFALRAWTSNNDRWVRIRSELTLAVHGALKEAGIEIPFPQRDLHLRSMDKALGEALGKRR